MRKTDEHQKLFHERDVNLHGLNMISNYLGTV